MKKLLSILLVVFLVATFAVGCGGTDNGDNGGDEAKYEDGIYFAQDEKGESWTYFVVVEVAYGKIADAHWGGTNLVPQGNKYTASVEGNYNMGGAAEWYEQADAAIAWLIENQDPALFDDLYTDEDGHTDALKTDDGTAVSVHVVEFFELAKKALASDPVPAGEQTTPDDYVATAALPAEADGVWEYRLDLIVVNGTILDSSYNSLFVGPFNADNAKYFINGDETKPSNKVLLGMDYGMDWKGNAEKIDAFVEANNGFEVEYKDGEGHTDSITGVSIHVNEYETLYKDALGIQ